jgi:hypothetical protein
LKYIKQNKENKQMDVHLNNIHYIAKRQGEVSEFYEPGTLNLLPCLAKKAALDTDAEYPVVARSMPFLGVVAVRLVEVTA